MTVEQPAGVPPDLDAAKAGMVVSVIGGVIAMMFAIGKFMTSELDSDMAFLYLGAGAFLLVVLSGGFVELQFRRRGAISIIHDYVLGFSHLFAVLAAFWISRWAIWFSCPDVPDDGLFCHGDPFVEGWMPAEWAVLVQAVVFVLVGLGQWRMNQRVGAGTLPRLVTVLSPLVILLVGAAIWVDWSDGTIPLPLLLSALALMGLGMWLGAASDRAPLFLASALLSSVIPLVYEVMVGGGAGLSMLPMVVLMQGLFASAKGLSRSMIQHGSILLVLFVLAAQFIAVVSDLPFVLVNEIDLPLLTLPLVLWLSLLIGYFAPVHMRRVPWMPIGLAVGLSFLPAPGSQLAWSLALLAFIYMLTRPQTRRWVADWTYAMLATSWFMVDWLTSFGGPFGVLELDPFFLVLPPVALLVLGEAASRSGRLSRTPYHAAVVLTLLSHEMLFGSGWLLPIGFCLFLLLLVLRQAINVNSVAEDDHGTRRDMSMIVLLAGASILLLELFGRLDSGFGSRFGLEGFGVEALLLGVSLYALGRHLRVRELDLGHLFGWLVKSGTAVTEWDPTTGTWAERSPPATDRFEGTTWGPAMRSSLILPLTIFSVAASGLTETWAVALLLLPVAVLMREVLFELPRNDATRAGGAWLLLFVGLPWAWRINSGLWASDATALQPAQLLFDVIMLAGPLVGELLLRKRTQDGSEKNMTAAHMTILAVLAIGLLDTSGGLLMLPLFAIAFIRSLQHRLAHALSALPFIWIFGALLLASPKPSLIGLLPEIPYLVAEKSSVVFGIDYPVWAGLGWVILGLVPLVMFALDRRADAKGVETSAIAMPTLIPCLSLFVGMHLLIPEPHWLLLIGVVVAAFAARSTGQLAYFWAWPALFFAALVFVLIEENVSDPVETAAFATTFVAWLTHLLWFRGLMTNRATPAIEGGHPNGVQQDWRCLYQDTRQYISTAQIGYAVVFALFSASIFGGAALLATAIGLTIRAYLREEGHLLLWLPLLHAYALSNTVDLLFGEEWALEVGGLVLLIEASLWTWASWRYWDFEWKDWDDEQVLAHSNHAGIVGAVLFPIGALFIAEDPGMWLFGIMLSVFGGFQMAIGFERDEGWRRIYPLIAIPTGILIVASEVDNGVLQGVFYLLAALSLFGQAFLYMTRAGIGMAGTKAEAAEHFEPLTAGPPQAEPGVEQSASEAEPESSADAEVVAEAVVEEPAAPASPKPTAPPRPSRFASGEGFDVELPADILAGIRTALEQGDHPGWKPIVRWDQYGRVILDYEEDTV
jgi:hypothetical protein